MSSDFQKYALICKNLLNFGKINILKLEWEDLLSINLKE